MFATEQQSRDWKRYKQYTKEDIERAIFAVKEGMSALQAARKYKVPSRTLYDKVKKQGISRPHRNRTSCTISAAASSARFPTDMGSNHNGSIYSGMINHDLTNGRSAIEQAASILQSAFVKSRENSTDDDDVKLEIRETTPSPPPPSNHASFPHPQHQQNDHDDNEVEDLSMNRKTDARVIISPPIKQETTDIPENYSRK